MRTGIVHESARHLVYEIRKIVDYGHLLEEMGQPITWENIGDPIPMGEQMAPWIAEIVQNLLKDNASWGYCPSRGVKATREYLAEKINERGGVTVTPDDLLFVNGIADAINKIYDLIRRDARVLMPSPCYPTHLTSEYKRGDYEGLQYRMDPRSGWLPDLDEIRAKVKHNPQIVAITLTNPDNPTGMVYPREILEEIVEIARQSNLFIICDEIYSHICYNGKTGTHISTVVGDVPAIALRGISKEYPWPGSRCGWLEILNSDKSPEFAEYAAALVNSKMMEVCSTTLPQMSIPEVFSDSRYPDHLKTRAAIFERRANEAYDFFKEMECVVVTRPEGAFYFCVVFKEGVLSNTQTLPISNPGIRELVESKVKGVANDKRFVYYLMASLGVCVTPLAGFHSSLEGFRITLLQTNDEIRRGTLKRIREGIESYIS